MTTTAMTVAQVLDEVRAVARRKAKASKAPRRPSMGDVSDGSVYLMDPRLVLAVQVAVATGRPLLLTGDPGTGKSTLARYLADQLGWRYYEHVVTGRTEASDLLWQFDTVRKLGDASGTKDLDDRHYVEPGVLWWALDRKSASRRGAGRELPAEAQARPKAPADKLQAEEPRAEENAGRSPHHAVVLIDEIDKADPDVPNALLVPLGSGRFVVRETQLTVQAAAVAGEPTPGGAWAAPVLVIITSNGERELPPAFLRRCVTHQLESPDPARLSQIALAHARREGRNPDAAELARIDDLAAQAVRIREELRALNRKGAGTAEFLDAVRASRELGLGANRKDDWERLLALTLRKDAGRTG